MRINIYILIFVTFCLPAHLFSQQTALKTNIIYWGTTSPNAGIEIGIGQKFSVDMWAAYNAWKFRNGMILNFYLVQPEIRYWLCRKYEGHFVGLHGHYGHFNFGLMPFIPNLQKHILRGDLYGGGLTYGYHWALSDHWGLEAMIGAGFAYMDYKKYRCEGCAEPAGSYTRNYIGPTRLGVSIIYFIR